MVMFTQDFQKPQSLVLFFLHCAFQVPECPYGSFSNGIFNSNIKESLSSEEIENTNELIVYSPINYVHYHEYIHPPYFEDNYLPNNLHFQMFSEVFIQVTRLSLIFVLEETLGFKERQSQSTEHEIHSTTTTGIKELKFALVIIGY